MIYIRNESTNPVIRAIHNIGVTSAFNSRNDVAIEDRKISGNAQFIIERTLRSFSPAFLLAQNGSFPN